MCIAIYKPKNVTIPKETLAQCFKSNSDGAGFMYNKKKELHIEKGFFTFDEFWEAYESKQKEQVVLHFRIKTHGPINVNNCHPFSVNPSLAFVHNGIISGFGDAEKSDTWKFNEEILQPMVAKWGNLALFTDPVKNLIEGRIGYSKLIFLDRHGNADIFNEDKGVWHNGVWYSNTSYKIPEPYVPPVKSTAVNSYDKESNYAWFRRTYGGTLMAEAGLKTASEIVKEGSYVCLTQNFYDNDNKELHGKGDILEVVSVNRDYTVDCMTDDAQSFVYNVPFYKLEHLINDVDYSVDTEDNYPIV